MHLAPGFPLLTRLFLLILIVFRQSIAVSVENESSSDGPARYIAEVQRISELALSPDGQWVIYTVSRGSVADNNYVTELLLQRTDAGSRKVTIEPIRLARIVSDATERFTPRWRPDARSLTFFEERTLAGVARKLTQYRLSDGQRIPLALTKSAPEFGSDYKWSPNGTRIAYTAAFDGGPIDPRHGQVASVNWSEWTTQSRSGVFVFDLESGGTTRVSPDTMHVHRFDWSPDEKAIVVSATPDAEGNPMFRTDLFVIELSTKTARPLVVQSGVDDGPAWSPDGKWIAFGSRHGERANYGGWLSIVPASGGETIRLASENDPLLSLESASWTLDSRGIYYSGRYRMSTRLFRADLATRRTALISADNQTTDASFSFDRHRKRAAFIRQSPLQPPEVFIQDFTTGQSRRLTQLSGDDPWHSRIRSETVSWPSLDGKFTVHGLLLTPNSSWRDENDASRSQRADSDSGGEGGARPLKPLPTVVFLTGGPGMVVRDFSPGENGGSNVFLPMVARGYAVLVPNTRGRPGYGDAFLKGIRDGSSAGRLPYEDMMSGIDYLIRRGIADPSRLGIYGHSYGGYLTAYALTQTDRFKAANIHEGGVAEWLSYAIWSSDPDSDWALVQRDLTGIQNVYDPIERKRLIDESPGLNADKIVTPVLLQYGARPDGNARRAGAQLFHVFQRFHVPSEFVIYDEGHGIHRPAAIASSTAAIADWFDFWIENRVDDASAKAEQYRRWSRLRGGKNEHRDADVAE